MVTSSHKAMLEFAKACGIVVRHTWQSWDLNNQGIIKPTLPKPTLPKSNLLGNGFDLEKIQLMWGQKQ